MDTMEQPTWLKTEYFAECLRNEKENKELVVIKLRNNTGSLAGCSFGSSITRIEVEYTYSNKRSEQQRQCFIAKSDLPDGPIKEMYVEPNITERKFYKRFLPEARKLVGIDFIPMNSPFPDENVIILEDLVQEGFMMADRINHLDFDHCRLFAVAAAKFHAASFAVHKKHPQLVESIGEEKTYAHHCKNADMYKTMIRHGVNCFADHMERFDKFKKYSSLIRGFSDELWNIVVEIMKSPHNLKTLTHGDPWTANCMFKYGNDGTVSHIKLLDFQMLRYDSPLTDMVHFTWTSANHDVRKCRVGELYNIYLDAFNKGMGDLNCNERLTFEEVLDHSKKLSPLILLIVTIIEPNISKRIPLRFEVFVDKEQGTDGEENLFSPCYDEIYRTNHLPQLLEDLDSLDIFTNLYTYKKT